VRIHSCHLAALHFTDATLWIQDDDVDVGAIFHAINSSASGVATCCSNNRHLLLTLSQDVIKQAAENYPETDFYDVDALLTQLGIGEAFVTVLNEKGIPTPLVHTMLLPPRSRMDILSEDEIRDLVSNSKLVQQYATTLDSESAYELITAKLNEAAERSAQKEEETNSKKEVRPQKEEGFFDHPVVKQVGRTAAAIITRSLLGALGLGGRSRKNRLF
jgi:hypothetical protein